MKDKRGQFYLFAAIIIISLIIGFAAISNYSKITLSTKTYDLGEELEIESAEVLDYGTYNTDTVNKTELLENFIEEYSLYGEIEELYFIFGSSEEITVMGYNRVTEEIIILDVEESTKHKIIVTINEIEYEFNLKSGENFYFIIIQTIEDEEYIYVGGD